jgi:hypothetical protein
MMAKPLAAGSEIDAWCTRCRLDLGHRIVAMVDKRPKRVICLTCNSEHNYRPPHSGPAAKEPRPSVAERAPRRASPEATGHSSRSALRQLADWEAHVVGQAVDAFTRYSVDKEYEPGQLVLHRRFGEGYVMQRVDTDKITVMFRDGPRVLVQGQR